VTNYGGNACKFGARNVAIHLLRCASVPPTAPGPAIGVQRGESTPPASTPSAVSTHERPTPAPRPRIAATWAQRLCSCMRRPRQRASGASAQGGELEERAASVEVAALAYAVRQRDDTRGSNSARSPPASGAVDRAMSPVEAALLPFAPVGDTQYHVSLTPSAAMVPPSDPAGVAALEGLGPSSLVAGEVTWLRVEVVDDGRGVAAGQQGSLFQPWQQVAGMSGADHGGRVGISGTGLGLYLCRELAVRHGGRVGMTSEPGVRTVFWLEVPVREVAIMQLAITTVTHASADAPAPPAESTVTGSTQPPGVAVSPSALPQHISLQAGHTSHSDGNAGAFTEHAVVSGMAPARGTSVAVTADMPQQQVSSMQTGTAVGGAAGGTVTVGRRPSRHVDVALSRGLSGDADSPLNGAGRSRRASRTGITAGLALSMGDGSAAPLRVATPSPVGSGRCSQAWAEAGVPTPHAAGGTLSSLRASVDRAGSPSAAWVAHSPSHAGTAAAALAPRSPSAAMGDHASLLSSADHDLTNPTRSVSPAAVGSSSVGMPSTATGAPFDSLDGHRPTAVTTVAAPRPALPPMPSRSISSSLPSGAHAHGSSGSVATAAYTPHTSARALLGGLGVGSTFSPGGRQGIRSVPSASALLGGAGVGLAATTSAAAAHETGDGMGTTSAAASMSTAAGGSGAGSRLFSSRPGERPTLLPLTALAVDDDASIRKLMARRLGRLFPHGRVLAAENGRLAIDALLAERAVGRREVDFVCLDANMPVMSGYEAAAALRSEHGYAGLIIGVTGNAMAEDMARFRACGCDVVLSKPVDFDAIMSLVLERCAAIPLALGNGGGSVAGASPASARHHHDSESPSSSAGPGGGDDGSMGGGGGASPGALVGLASRGGRGGTAVRRTSVASGGTNASGSGGSGGSSGRKVG
jgi:CheY-like chemotaxis protein